MFKQSLVNLLLASLVLAVPCARADFKQDAQENAKYVAAKILKGTKKALNTALYATRVAAGTAGVTVGTLGAGLGCFGLATIHIARLTAQVDKELYYMSSSKKNELSLLIQRVPLACTACVATLLVCASALAYVSYKYMLPSSDNQAPEKPHYVVLASVGTAANLDNQ